MDEWLTLEQARARTGLHPDTLRKQVRKGGREGRKDNHGRWLVRVNPDEPGPVLGPTYPDGPDVPARTDPDVTRALAERDVQIARLEERLAAAEAARAELREQVAALRAELTEGRAERDRLLGLVEQLAAERRPERRLSEGNGSG